MSYQDKTKAFSKAKENTTYDDRKNINDTEEPIDNANLIAGRNPVMEALKSGHEINKLVISKDAEGSIKKIIGDAMERKIPIHYVDKIAIDRLCPDCQHQGVLAYISPYKYCELDDIFKVAKNKKEDLFIIVLDEIVDPHNFGAIIRTANACGAHGIVIPKRRSVSITDTVVKASAGAVEYVPIARVPNLVQAIEKIKEEGAWVHALDTGGENLFKTNMKGKMAIVVGGEGDGLGRLVKEKCDLSVSIPMRGEINSLNASNAAAIVMYEVFRQRNI
ncbi:MAG: 23S rRNA (guanosine(2251)-2'-O)-methyltransferase RlmB [Eubacteriales bacterium]